jgi:two-component system sensor histidine kinase BarA
MKYRSNLRSHIAFFVLAPGIACALLIGAYLTYALVRDITLYEKHMGNAYSEQIVRQSFSTLQAGNIEALRNTAQLALEYPLLRSITFYDAQQNELLHAGPRHSPLNNITDRLQLDQIEIESEGKRQLFIPVIEYRLAGSQPKTENAGLNRYQSKPAGWVRLEFSQDFIIFHKYHTIIFDICVVFAVLACAFWLVMPFSDRLAETLRDFTRNARSIGKEDRRPPTHSSNIIEMQELGLAIEDMHTSIADQQENLQQYIDQSTQDLRETLETIEIQNIELDLARREAVQASKIKSEFLANTSHEIRTPLNSIIGFSKLLLKSSLSDQQQDYLQNIRKSSENLLTIINDVLDLSKIEAGKLVLDYVVFDINDTLEEILQILAPGAHDKGLELLQMVYSDVPRQLIGDPLRLKQVLTNLISNAIKFSEMGNIVIRIAMESTDAQQVLLKIDVTDSGKGLPNDNQMIFNAFTQLDSSSTREYSGTGLGLAISRKIVEQMGGDIGYNSKPGNTTFWFTVRFDIAARPFIKPVPNSLLEGRHILVYDQEQLCRLSISHPLNSWGILPVLTESLGQIIPALERHKENGKHIDAIMLSLNVRHSQQEMKQLLQSAQYFNDNYHCPVLLCMPTSARQNLSTTRNKNISFLTKPLTETRLYHALCQALALEPPANEAQTGIVPNRSGNHTIRVLAVDDNPPNLQLLSTILRDLGAEVIEACDGAEAVQVFRDNSDIAMIFMDIQMPVMDGIEATRKIRQLESLHGTHVPIIALTAHALAEQRQNMLMSGLDDYLSKPATEQQLLQMLEKWQQYDAAPTGKIAPELNKYVPDAKLDRCINRTAALQASGNRTDIAIQMLGMLLETLATERDHIVAALEKNDMRLAEMHIHKLHGASCYCGVTDLKNCCSAIETLIKKDMTEHIPDVLVRFNESVDLLLQWHEKNSLAAFFSAA